MTYEELFNTFEENKTVYDALLKQINENRITPIFGAGMPVWAGYPLWREVLSKMATDTTVSIEVETLLENEQFEQAASKLEKYYGKAVFYEKIESQYAQDFNEKERPEYQRYLPQLFKGAVVTTNFDVLIERLFNTSVIVPEDQYQENQFATTVQFNLQNVIKLHGDIENISSIVSTEERYNQVYGEDADSPDMSLPLPKALNTLFQSAPPFFLGCGLGSDRTSNILKLHNGLSGFALVELPKETFNSENSFNPIISDENGFIPAFSKRKKFLEKIGLQASWYPYREYDAVRVLVEKLHIDYLDCKETDALASSFKLSSSFLVLCIELFVILIGSMIMFTTDSDHRYTSAQTSVGIFAILGGLLV